MDCGLFGVRFLFLGHKNGAAAPVDYLSTFATAPQFLYLLPIQKLFFPFPPLCDPVFWDSYRTISPYLWCEADFFSADIKILEQKYASDQQNADRCIHDFSSPHSSLPPYYTNDIPNFILLQLQKRENTEFLKFSKRISWLSASKRAQLRSAVPVSHLRLSIHFLL